MSRIVVIVKGGFVQEIKTDECIGDVEAVVVDYDVDERNINRFPIDSAPKFVEEHFRAADLP